MESVEFIKKGGRRFAALLFFLGVLQVSGYYLAGSLVRDDGCFAMPQPDTALYCQAACRLAEGHPFSFSEGERPTTGTTSHLYPVILAVPYCLGARGPTLLRAGFFLNAAFYLVFLFAWGSIIWTKCSNEFTRNVAAISLALFGQSAFSAFSQTDIGFWMAASAMLAMGFAQRRFGLYAVFLLLGPWIRPEGMYCVFGFVLATGLALVPSLGFLGNVRKRDWVLCASALMSVAGVFVFNYHLTGDPSFSSLAHKGHFTTKPLGMAVYATACDFVVLLKSLLLGIPATPPRDLYFIPVLGAVCLWVGILFRNWKISCDRLEFAWWLAAGGGLLSVSLSGMQDMNMDRYLAWSLPVIPVFTAVGAVRIKTWISEFQGFANLPIALILFFSAGMSVVSMCVLNQTSTLSDMKRDFARRVGSVIPHDASLGSWGSVGGVYELGNRRMAHLCGIYSRDFMSRHIESGAIEKLKNERILRFDYFLNLDPSDFIGFGEGEPFADSEQVLVGPGGCELRKMNWSSFEAGSRVPDAPIPGLVLKARVDVAYEKDEEVSDYRVVPTYNIPVFTPFMLTAENRGVRMTDCGRVIVGYDEMSVSLDPGRDVYVVMRVYPHRRVMLRSFGGGSSDYAFANPLKLNLSVDEQLVGSAEVAYSASGFSDVSFCIPGSSIRNPISRIAFLGDHITCGYWFYQ